MFDGTTILCIRKDGKTVMAGDGQVSLGQTVLKRTAVKVRRLTDYPILAGFAGSTADAFTLFEKFESKLKDFSGNLTRAAVELAKEWRTDRYLRRLEALLLVADREKMLMLSGTGDVVEPDESVAAIGSGGMYALAAAQALMKHAPLDARRIAEEALSIAADICVYTNHNIHAEEL
ncbi:MAG: ATP-dependent protease subunit HslV [Myxococcales bacterium]|nr:MAG: ATP-dependent protease subunit HslV [Myxococcales bacterium]